MVRNDLRLKIMSKAALYSYLKKRHVSKKRWFYAGQAFLMAMILIVSIILQTYLEVKPPTYKLDATTYNLIGESRDDAAKYLTRDEQESAFKFALPEEKDTSSKQHGGRSADAYEATLATDAKQGITYTDTASKIGITIKPLFRTGEGKKVDGDHIVYPMGAQKLVYTLKYNGLKEDIIVPKFLGDELDYEFELSLPAGVEARLDANGNIGIFSSDTSLFGDISYGSEEDRSKVDKAREKGEKNNLVVTIPSPIVKDASGQEHSDKASFRLGEKRSEQVETANEQKSLPAEVRQKLSALSTRNVYSLKLAAKSLKDLPYPISVDPTIQSTSASDWTKGSFEEGGIDIDTTNNLIKRSSLTGAETASWAAQTAAPFCATRFGNVVNNGYMYILGGDEGNSDCSVTAFTATVRVSQLTTSGGVGAWSTTSSLPVATHNAAVTTYGGYVYYTGGGSTSLLNSAYYAKFGNNGEIIKPPGCSGVSGTNWCAATNLASARNNHQVLAYKGKFYVIGGCTTLVISSSNCSVVTTDIAYASINADGSLGGSWTSTLNSYTTARQNHEALIYNGFMYVTGGQTSSVPSLTSLDTTYYGKISSTGDIPDWSAGTSLPNARGNHGSVAVNGYLYINGGGAGTSATEYAQINSDGSLGSWVTAGATMINTRLSHGFVTYAGYLFAVVGANAASNFKAIESAQIRVAGATGTYTTTSTISGRLNAGTAVSDGYIYVIAGCSTTTCKDSDGLGNGYRKDIQYAPINSNGTIGTWSSGGDIPATGTSKAGRMDTYAVATNGYLYIVGGYACNTLCTGDDHKADILVGKLNAGGGITASGMSIGACVNQNFCAASNSMPLARSRHGAIAYGNYLYVMGGYDGSNTLSSGVYASFGGGGDLNAFTATTSFDNSNSTAIRGYFPLVEHAGYVYAIGGYNAGVSRSDIQKAAINSDGSLGSWSITGNSNLPAARSASVAAVANGRLYVMGGGNGDNDVQATVYIGDFTSNGTISSWTTSPNSMATGRAGAGNPGLYANGHFYYVSGCSAISSNQCTSFKTDVDYVRINNGGSGSSGTAVASANVFTNARTQQSTVVSRGYLYVIGGCITNTSCSTATNSVQKAAINADGSLGTWSAVTNISNSVYNHSAVAYNDHIYVMGGHNTTSAISTVEYTKVKTDGTLEAPTGCGASIWCATTSLPAIRSNHSSVTYNGYIYVIGGNSTGHILYIKINSDGTLASSWSSGTDAGIGMDGAVVAAYNGFLYIIWDSTTTISSAINSTNGSIGTWNNTTPLTRNQNTSFAVAANGYMYVVAGSSGSDTSAIQFAPILGNGKLGKWQFSPNTLGSARANTSGVYYNGRIYAAGGNTGGTLLDTTRYFSPQFISRTGTYSRFIDFDNGVKPTKLITRGTKRNGAIVSVNYKSVNNTSSTFSNDQTVSDTGYNGANAMSFSLGSGVTLSRYLVVRYTVDDTMSAIFPDGGNESSITDYDVYFTANPGARLRGGRTFIDGADRGLDAQP